MMTTTVSAGEAAKELVLNAIKARGGTVAASNLAGLRTKLGLDGEVSIKALQSALWKLSCTDEVRTLRFSRDLNKHYEGPRGFEPKYIRIRYTVL